MINETQTHMTETPPTSFGTRLKSAREARGLDCKDVASQLRLSEKVIIMLESENYASDLPITFIRGYIRSYSKFLDIPDHEVKTALEPIQPKPAPYIESKTSVESITSGNYFMQILTCLIVFTVIGLVGMWWYSHSKTETNLSTLQPMGVETASTEVTTRTENDTGKAEALPIPPSAEATPIQQEVKQVKKELFSSKNALMAMGENSFVRFLTHTTMFMLALFLLWRYRRIAVFAFTEKPLTVPESSFQPLRDNKTASSGMSIHIPRMFKKSYELNKIIRIAIPLILFSTIAVFVLARHNHAKHHHPHTDTPAAPSVLTPTEYQPLANPGVLIFPVGNKATSANNETKNIETTEPKKTAKSTPHKKMAKRVIAKPVDPYETEANNNTETDSDIAD